MRGIDLAYFPFYKRDARAQQRGEIDGYLTVIARIYGGLVKQRREIVIVVGTISSIFGIAVLSTGLRLMRSQ